MATITYVHPDGTTTALEAEDGDSVMRTAVLNGLDGIVAQCGGGASCGTCHVFVDPASRVPLPRMHAVEDELLYGTACPRQDGSRLSCQLPVDDLDGLVVHVPERQV